MFFFARPGFSNKSPSNLCGPTAEVLATVLRPSSYKPTPVQIEQLIQREIEREMNKEATLNYLKNTPPHLVDLARFALRRYARVNAECSLEIMQAKLTGKEWRDPNTPHIFADHGTGHAADIVAQTKDFLDHALLSNKVKERTQAESAGMKDYAQMLAWLHDTGMQDLSGEGRKAHPDRQAVDMYVPNKEFDRLIENLLNSKSPLIAEIKKQLPGENVESVLRDLLSLARAHSKSNVPPDLLMYPKELGENMRAAMLKESKRQLDAKMITQSQYDVALERIKKSFMWTEKVSGILTGSPGFFKKAPSLKEDLLAWLNKNKNGFTVEGFEIDAATLEKARIEIADLGPGDSGIQRLKSALKTIPDTDPTKKKLNKLIEHLGDGEWTRNYNATHPFAQNIGDVLRALRSGDVLRQRMENYRTSGNQQVYVNPDLEPTKAEVKLVDPHTGKTIIFHRDSPYATGESLTGVDFTEKGDFRFTIPPGTRHPKLLEDVSFVFEDVKDDGLASFLGVRNEKGELVKPKIKIVIRCEESVQKELKTLLEKKGLKNIEFSFEGFTPPPVDSVGLDRWRNAPELNDQELKKEIDYLKETFQKNYAITPKTLDIPLEELRNGIKLVTVSSDAPIILGGHAADRVYISKQPIIGIPTATNALFSIPEGTVIGDVGVVRGTQGYPGTRGASVYNTTGKPIQILAISPKLYKKIHAELIVPNAEIPKKIKELFPDSSPALDPK